MVSQYLNIQAPSLIVSFFDMSQDFWAAKQPLNANSHCSSGRTKWLAELMVQGLTVSALPPPTTLFQVASCLAVGDGSLSASGSHPSQLGRKHFPSPVV